MSDHATPPQRTDKPEEALTVTGMLFPWDTDGDHPVTFYPVGSPLPHVMLFDNEDTLRAFMGVICPDDKYTIKQVEDGPEFLSSVPKGLVLAANPWFTEDGKIRYLQLQRG